MLYNKYSEVVFHTFTFFSHGGHGKVKLCRIFKLLKNRKSCMQHSSHCRRSRSAGSTQLDSVDQLPRVRRWCTVELICSDCNFQKPNTLEIQAVCVNLTNPGCIFVDHCHVNGLWRHCNTPEMKRETLMCAVTPKREKQIQTNQSRLLLAVYLIPHCCHVFYLVHRQVDITLGGQVKQTAHLI